MTGVQIWLLICAVLGAAYLIARRFDRRADRTIRAYLDQAMLHGGDWDEVDGEACLDCAADQAMAIAADRQPSHLSDMPEHPERLDVRDDYIERHLRAIEDAEYPRTLRVWLLTEESNP